MISWIRSQNITITVLLVCVLRCASAALVLVAVIPVARRRIAVDLKATSPVMPTPLSAVAALVITFRARARG